MEEALSTILREKTECTGAGRTDTGVHASYFIAHFDSTINDLSEKQKIVQSLNGFLPSDISVKNIIRVNKDAHARFDAISRTYQYKIYQQKNPFLKDLACFFPQQINVEMMQQATSVLFEFNDFSSFSKLHSDNKTNLCSIKKAEWFYEGGLLIFEITADRFLRNMVRAITGTLLDLGREKTTLEEFRNIIDSKDRSKAGFSAPAEGLYLVNIEYPDRVYSS